MTFGERLSRLRTNMGLSQSELADRLNIAKSTLAMYETDKREPSFETTQRLAKFFDVSIDYLVSGKIGGNESMDPEWLELWEQVKEKGMEIDAKAFLRTTAKDGVTKAQLRDILRVYEHISQRQHDNGDK